jgi:hypothetical protein
LPMWLAVAKVSKPAPSSTKLACARLRRVPRRRLPQNGLRTTKVDRRTIMWTSQLLRRVRSSFLRRSRTIPAWRSDSSRMRGGSSRTWCGGTLKRREDRLFARSSRPPHSRSSLEDLRNSARLALPKQKGSKRRIQPPQGCFGRASSQIAVNARRSCVASGRLL